jgi:putative SOS response-associated peptidase YedK
MPTSAGAAFSRSTTFFEWRAIKGAKAKRPDAIGLKSGEPFALAAIWENWQRPGTDGSAPLRSSHALPTTWWQNIHDPMPVIVPP